MGICNERARYLNDGVLAWICLSKMILIQWGWEGGGGAFMAGRHCPCCLSMFLPNCSSSMTTGQIFFKLYTMIEGITLMGLGTFSFQILRAYFYACTDFFQWCQKFMKFTVHVSEMGKRRSRLSLVFIDNLSSPAYLEHTFVLPVKIVIKSWDRFQVTEMDTLR